MAAALGPVTAGCISSGDSDATTETVADATAASGGGTTSTPPSATESGTEASPSTRDAAEARTTGTPATETTTGTPTTLRTVTVEDVTPAPDESELSFSAETVASAVTTEATAVVRVTVTNEASEARRVGSGHRPAFSAVYSEEDDPGTVLLDPESDLEVPTEYGRVAPDCWRPDETISIAGVLRRVELGSGESESVDLEVWASPLNEEGCLEPGTYRFEDEYVVEAAAEPSGVRTVEWDGFALRVTDP